MTIKYLKALNLLFENGILSSEHVSYTESAVLQNMDLGFKYFDDWPE